LQVHLCIERCWMLASSRVGPRTDATCPDQLAGTGCRDSRRGLALRL